MIKLQPGFATNACYKYDKDDKGAKAGIPPFRKECLTLARAKTDRRYN